jgi:diguanylate cyclase (GGDEF)-like protein
MAGSTGESGPGVPQTPENGVHVRAFEVVLRCFADAVGADVALFSARDMGSDPHPRLVASWSREGRDPAAPGSAEDLLGRVIEAELPLVTPSGNGKGPGVSAVAAAVTSHEQTVGAIYAGFEPSSVQPCEELVWVTESYARLAGLCMFRNDGAVAEVLGSAGVDTLTGCLSYGATIELVSGEIKRSQRHGHRLSCCMIDLDGFKNVNDLRGHLEGNRVLAAVGAGLRSAAREYDSVGRFGGDEFVIVLPETGVLPGQQLAGRFLAKAEAAIAATTTVHAGASVGLVEWDGEGSAIDLLEAADRLMREAKATGGARVRADRFRAPPKDEVATFQDHLLLPRRPGRPGCHGG